MTDPFDSLLSELQPKVVAPVVSSDPVEVADTSNVTRLSINENVFRLLGDTVEELGDGPLKVAIVKAAPVSRVFYSGEYVHGKGKHPTCWAADANAGIPAKEVPTANKQSPTCFNCPQNIKGSGHGGGRACRFQQRIALMLANGEGVLDTNIAYQFAIPATSVFGKDKKKMGLQTYARLIDSQSALLSSIMTELSFDEESDIPKVCFRPSRVLEEAEMKLVKQRQSDPYTKSLVSFIPKVYENNGPNVDNVFDVVEGEGVYVKDS